MSKRSYDGAFTGLPTNNGSTYGDALAFPIGNELNANMNARTSFNNSNGDSSIFSVNGLTSSTQQKKNTFLGRDGGGTPLSNYIPTNPLSNFLDAFKMPSNFRDAMPMKIPQTKYQTNAPINNRRLVKPYNVMYPDLLQQDDLCILYKNPRNANNTQSNSFSIQSFINKLRGNIYDDTQDDELIEGRYLEIMNVAAFNHFILDYQLELYNNNIEKFYNLTPDQLWKDFTFDGAAATVANEFTGDSQTSLTGLQVRGGGIKITTMIIKGEARLPNWFGPHTGSGSRLFAVIKKCEIPSQYNFINPGESILSGPGSIRVEEMPRFQQMKFKQKSSSELTFLPYQMCLMSDPDCNQICDIKYRTYNDEYGIKRKDGLSIYIGLLLFRQAAHLFEKYNSPDPESLKPFTNAGEGRTLDGDLKVVLTPNITNHMI